MSERPSQWTKSALLSECGTYRYWLKRDWDPQKARLVVVMVNPSTADAEVDDPTILRLIGFAHRWGYGGIHVVNLLGYRSSTQDCLMQVEDATGPDNPGHVTEALEYASTIGNFVLVAWGNGGDIVLPGSRYSEAEIFVDHADQVGVKMRCLGLTQSGAPKHPLARGKHRVPDDFTPIPFADLREAV